MSLTLAGLLARAGDSLLGRELVAIRGALVASPAEVFLVGGVVRDLLLERRSRDIDLAVAGELEEIAERLAAARGGEVRHHPSFLTADLTSRTGVRIDLARLRREFYSRPATLPRVEAGTLAQDLARRDFTVNAMAVALSEDSAPVLDPHGGIDDLSARQLRVLHPESFRDDPTRVLRGLRLKHQLGFDWERVTGSLVRAHGTREALASLHGYRLWRELSLCFADPTLATDVVSGLAELGLLAAIHPGLPPSLGGKASGDEVEPGPLRLLERWSRDLELNDRLALAERLSLTHRERRVLAPEV